MYTVDDRDRVLRRDDLPRPDVGAPCPLVVQHEGTVVVAYYVSAVDPAWTGESVRVVDPEASAEPAALVRFRLAYASMLGPPNDEAFSGHPLASRGLRPYAAAEVLDSSWTRRQERMNAVHP